MATADNINDWRPQADVETARMRAEMLARARAYFLAQNVLLVDTPALSRSAVSDPHIESLATQIDGSADQHFLHTSPEYGMKRLLAAGFPDIAQICRVFRDGEIGRVHQPEFTMIEWYRRDFALAEIMSDGEALLSTLLESEKDPIRISYRDAFLEHAGLDPMTAGLAELRAAAAANAELDASLGEDRDAWLDLLLATRVACGFERDRLTTLYHYPRSQAALSRINPQDDAVADRFEIFVGDLELANGYVELTDYAEQAARFAADQDARRARAAMLRPLDTQLIAALRAGLPPCAGIAVGFERVLMLRAGATDIRHVLHFPHGGPA